MPSASATAGELTRLNESVAQMFDAAFAQHQLGQIQAAKEIFERILLVEPDHAFTLHSLGLIAYQEHDYGTALRLVRRAVAANKQEAGFCYNLGLIYQAAKRPNEAIASFKKALSRNSQFAAAAHSLAEALARQGCHRAAEKYRAQALTIENHVAQEYNQQGIQLSAEGRTEEAIEVFKRGISCNPDAMALYNNLAIVLVENGEFDTAILCLTHAIARRPDNADLYINLGNTLGEIEKYAEANACYLKALAINPHSAAVLTNLANNLLDLGSVDEALAAIQRALALEPNFYQVRKTLAVILHEEGRLVEAISQLEIALQLDPGSASARFNMALCLLALGDFKLGWQLYEERFQQYYKSRTSCRSLGAVASSGFFQRRWAGEAVSGRAILLVAEQGFGDTLQFVRYAREVYRMGGRVILECQPELCRLLATVPGVQEVIPQNEELEERAWLPPFDFQCPLLSLPSVFQTTPSSIPADVPYVKAELKDVAKWKAILGEKTGTFRVGLVWESGDRKSTLDVRGISRRRNLPFALLGRLGSIKGVTFYSLQKGSAAEQIRTSPSTLKITDYTEALTDFAETAALIENLDLVISVDTAVAHLAGAIGKPVWLLLRFNGCWRWLTDREDSPWYPTMRIFRQPTKGDWEYVIGRVEIELRNLVATRQLGSK